MIYILAFGTLAHDLISISKWRCVSHAKPFLEFPWISLKASMTVLAVMLCCFSALATELCHDLPPSQLNIYHVFTNSVEEEPVEDDKLFQDFPSGVIASHQPMMTSAITLYSKFSIRNRSLPRDDGSVCASPELVELSLGFNRRLLLYPQQFEDDICVRDALRRHEQRHEDAFEAAVGRFIDERSADLKRGMLALKETPAESIPMAIERWQVGLRAILAEAMLQLAADLQTESARVDDAAEMERLKTSCDGRLGQFEHRRL
jgi:hypothetical protein